MNCSKCQNETFKVKVRRRRTKFTGFPEVTPVDLICSKCGHNVKVYIVKEDMKYIRHKLENIESVVGEIHDDFRTVIEIYQEKPKVKEKKKKRVWQR